MTRTIVCILLILYLAAFGLGYLTAAEVTVTSLMPRCQEDVVIIGYGQFDDGIWSDYGCGPAVDNYKEN